MAKKIFRCFNIVTMRIDFDTSVNFNSKAYPIMPYVIKTKHGKLRVYEVSQKDLDIDRFIEKLTKFFSQNFASMTNDPEWRIFSNKHHHKYKMMFENLASHYTSKVKTDDSHRTLLLVKDKRNKIQGACLSYGFDKLPNFKDKVCYIDSIAVNPAYRRYNIGKSLLIKSLEAAQNTFKDAFLIGERLAFGFYSKIGFKPMDKKHEGQALIIDSLSHFQNDYPQYVEFFTKSLNDSKKRWYEL